MGRELALLLVQRGAKVAIADISEAGMADTVAMAGDRQDRLSTHKLDVSSREQVEALPKAVIEAHGAVDAIINNAGIIQPFVKVQDLDLTAIERVMHINFYGTLYMIKAFLPHLRQRPEGYIANVSSMGGFLPVPGQALYGASKAAVKLLTEALYTELKDTNINVTVIFPGAVATNITENSGVSAPGGADADTSDFKALPAPEAARIMVDGIARNKYRVLVGKDARFMDFMSRLAPQRAANLIYKNMKSLLDG